LRSISEFRFLKLLRERSFGSVLGEAFDAPEILARLREDKTDAAILAAI